ncbi:MAG: hypothetical protein J3K34DRAFT_431123, partial [Monoraphidium minutum]
MNTRSKAQRLAAAAPPAGSAVATRAAPQQLTWASIDENLFHLITADMARREVIRLGGVCAAWRRAVWGAAASLTVISRMDGLARMDETGLVAWLASRLASAPRLRCLRVGCGYDQVAAVIAAATLHARGLTALELSFYTGEGVQGPLPAGTLQGLSRLRSLRALALGTGGDVPQPHITRIGALRQLTRLEMPYAQMTPASLATLSRRLPGLRKAWLDCPDHASWGTVARGLSRLTDLRLDLRLDGGGFLPVAAHTLSALPTTLVSLQITGALFHLASLPFARLPHLVELGVHDRVLEGAEPGDVTAAAGRLRHLGLYLSTVGFMEASDPEDEGLALDEPLDVWAWVPVLRALTAVTRLSLNSFVADNRCALPCLYTCALGLPGRVRHLHLYNISLADDAADILPLAARRWAGCLSKLTLHCCEGVTAPALAAL